MPQNWQFIRIPSCPGLVGVRQPNEVEHEGVDDFVRKVEFLVDQDTDE